MQALLEKYEGDKERCGFILRNGDIVEVHNIAPEPEHSFLADAADVLKYVNDAAATWHTHPGSGSNLSPGDMETFLFWPQCEHYIVGNDGVACYYVKNNTVLRK